MHKIMNYICKPLILIGAINWGLIGAFNFNLVSVLFGVNTILTNIIYILVGISGLCGLYMYGQTCKLNKNNMR